MVVDGLPEQPVLVLGAKHINDKVQSAALRKREGYLQSAVLREAVNQFECVFVFDQQGCISVGVPLALRESSSSRLSLSEL